MGITYANVLTQNFEDLREVKKGTRAINDVRQINVEFVVDTGAHRLAINETIARQLGLEEISRDEAELADGSRIELPVVGPIWLEYLTRSAMFDAYVLPGDAQPLFSVVQMEVLDLIVDPKERMLTTPPSRPYRAQHFLKRLAR